jgi:hypothetical protein
MRRAHRRAHRAIWLALALLLPAILMGAAALRITRPPADAPVWIAP